MPEQLRQISSRDNPQFKALKKAVQGNSAYKKEGWVWLEGDHLCLAALKRGLKPSLWVISESFYSSVQVSTSFVAIKNVVGTQACMLLPDELMAQLCTQDERAALACCLPLPAVPELDPQAATLVLDRVQDAGNVGTLLRCAAAFGYGQVLATAGTAALWSPKVLRAGMGAHFGLKLYEGLAVEAMAQLQMPRLATSSHQGEYLHTAQLPWPHAWLMGNEGEGLSAQAQALATQHIRIAQPGGEESLNVAAAAAICMHAGARK